jgi:carboxyl-terminal processing protease
MQYDTKFNIKAFNLFLALLLVFGGGYWLGRSQDSTTGSTPVAVTHQNSGKPGSVDFSLFWDAWNVVSDKYVKTPNDQDRVYGAISGMVAGLGDPFSVYMKPTETTRFNEDINGNFEGIGAELIQKDGFVTVVSALDDSPAAKAGLKPDDVIVKIDDKDTPTSLEDAVKLIRGQKGTQVKLGIVRHGKAQEFIITRDTVEVKSVTYTHKDDLGVIKINQFTGNTTKLLDDALTKAKQDNVKGLVLDLRNNPGGLLTVAVEVSSRFMQPGTVVIERDKANKETPLNTVDVTDKTTTPMVVLVNKGSASASEIFAGAIQDSGRAKIVGETTFGKGSVQSIEPLKDGSSVRITIAEWLTPKKREINKVGVKPDIEVSITDDDVKNSRDPQYDKAKELLK